MVMLRGDLVELRPATASDIDALAAIRRSPEVHAWWRGDGDMATEVARDLAEEAATPYVIVGAGRVVGWIQWSEETEPAYRHATLDLYVDPAIHRRGVGSDAIRTLLRHLVSHHGHRRFEIDPASANVAAIRCYAKVGFRPVGVRRLAERGSDGTWHDALLMDLLADEILG